MTDELKPCPLCENNVEAYTMWSSHMTHIVCEDCGMETRFFASEEECVEFWNNQPSNPKPIKWIKTPPTREDVGKVFVARYVYQKEIRYVVGPLFFGAGLQIANFSINTIANHFNAEFFGPLPN